MVKRVVRLVGFVLLLGLVGCTTQPPFVNLSGVPPSITQGDSVSPNATGGPGSSSGLWFYNFSSSCGGMFNPATIGPTSATTVQTIYNSTGAAIGPCTLTVRLITASGRSASSSANTTILAGPTVSWLLAGNAGTNPATDFLGTTDAQPLVFKTNNTEAMRIDTTQRVGIGTTSPIEKLTVDGNVAVTGIIDSIGQKSKIRFHYDTLADLPAASFYHGMFAHVHDTGKAYFAHAGMWVELQQRVSGSCSSGNAIRVINADGTVTCESVGGAAGWSLTGNALTGTEFLGSTNDVALEFKVNNARALRIEPASSPNFIGGFSGNSVSFTVVGATIGGGGEGGATNHVTDNYGTVGGGRNNLAGDNAGGPSSSPAATIGGGEGNRASGYAATVGGGSTNTASGPNATVGGGEGNTASGTNATVGGGRSNTASGGYATVGGGRSNTASGTRATVSGGEGNTASDRATVGGGEFNTASSPAATVGGGSTNTASGFVGATVGGGVLNTASGTDATVGGGRSNTASGTRATVGGGEGNTASGHAATVGGGVSNTAAGDYSFVVGLRAKNTDAAHDGVFIFADSNDADFSSTAANQFNVRASGGSRIFSNAGLTAGVTLAAGASAWASVSDRALKENFRALDGRAVLHKLSLIPIMQWNYKAQAAAIRHVGPTAQDFYAAFGLGESDKHISTIDADGIALLSIQALYQLSLEKDKKIEQLTKEIEALKQKAAKVDELQQRIEKLEKLVEALSKK